MIQRFIKNLTMKKTWYFWVMSNGNREGFYHTFKCFKVYYAYYKWLYSDERELERLKYNYLLCKANPSIIKMIFGKDINIIVVEEMIERLSNKIKNNYI